MSTPIRVLGIAPYEGMKTLMSNLAEEYPQMDLTLFVGDRELGLEIARANFHGNYDVVISRGDTAAMLRRDLSLPVVEIEVTMYDLLCAMKLADGLDGRTAFIAASSIAESARRLCEVMGDGMEIYTYDAQDKVEPILLELQRGSCRTVLCDALANVTAKRLGMNAFLVTSSVGSIRRAFDQAMLICGSKRRMREENLFLRELIQGQISQTVVFDQEGSLFLSTLNDPGPELLELLRRELPECQNDLERRIFRNLGGCCTPSGPGRSAPAIRPTPPFSWTPGRRPSPPVRRASASPPGRRRRAIFMTAFSASPAPSVTFRRRLPGSTRAAPR